MSPSILSGKGSVGTSSVLLLIRGGGMRQAMATLHSYRIANSLCTLSEALTANAEHASQFFAVCIWLDFQRLFKSMWISRSWWHPGVVFLCIYSLIAGFLELGSRIFYEYNWN